MNRIKLSLYFFALIVLSISCSSFKNELIKKNGIENAIYNAILDFSNTNNLYKKGNVFSVSVSELEKNSDLFVVRIGKNTSKMFYDKSIKLETQNQLASKYFKDRDLKLFYWYDENHPLEQKTIDTFNEYDLLTSSKLDILDSEIDDSQKAAHYYFCKNDLSTNYKKVNTNIGIGYYSPPNIKCN